MAAANENERKIDGVEIVVFDPAERPGPGLAYADDLPSNLLNRPTAMMSSTLEDPGEFQRWLCARAAAGSLDPASLEDGLAADAFVPRPLFGIYLEECFARVSAELESAGWTVRHVRATVSAIERRTVGYRVRTACGISTRARLVALCTGNAAAVTYGHLDASPGYFRSPYPSRRLAAIPPRARVALIGSRLTAIDAALALDALGHRGRTTMLSRLGLMPIVGRGAATHRLAPRTIEAIAHAKAHGAGSVSLWRLTRLILSEMSRAEGRRLRARDISGHGSSDPAATFLTSVLEAERGARGWQNAFAALLDHIADLWNGLTEVEKEKVRSRIYSRLEAVRVPTPLENGRRIAALLRRGRLDLDWPILDIRQDGAGFVASLGARDGRAERTTCFDVVVNCTGVSDGIDDPKCGLYSQLLASGAARRHRFGGIDVDPRTNGVVSAEDVVADDLFAIGVMTRGAFLITSSLAVNLVHVERVARQLFAAIGARLCTASPARRQSSPRRLAAPAE